MKRLAINGYGRIGRCILRALAERSDCHDLQIVAINEPADLETIAYLTRYDTTHGRFPGTVSTDGNSLVVNGQAIRVTHNTAIEDNDWQDIDLVLECSGEFKTRADAERHLARGAGKLLFSHPAETVADVDTTVVCGVNEHLLTSGARIVSNASCTTNCITPVLSVLQANYGVLAGNITTIHSVMNDQPVIDAYHHTDLRKTRSASQSLIPIETELAKGIDRILPELAGRFTAKAVRVPTTNVSAMDLVVQLANEVTAEQVNEVLQQASDNGMQGVLGYCDEPLASCDFNHDPRSSIIDAAQTAVSEKRLLKLFTWFDNEWGFANRMLDTAGLMLRE